MRSLYIKIFLWFWLAMALVIVTSIVSIWLTQSGVSNAREKGITKLVLPLVAERAAKIYDQDGKDAWAADVARFDELRGSRVFLFRSDGQEVLGRTPPTEATTLLQNSGHTDESQLEFRAARVFMAQRTRRTSGYYVLLIEMEPPDPPFLKGNVGIQALRLTSVFLVAGLVCFWLARYITAPVTKLSAATRQLAEGNLSARIGSGRMKRRDELGDLGRDFDRMAEHIETLIASQRRLMSDISHELRSPLARLSVALGIAWRNATPPIEGSLERIERETDRLNELIGILLTLASLESGAQTTFRETVDLEALLNEIAADANFEAQGRNVSVRILKSEACSIEGIRNALYSGFENVIRNAVSYTAAGSDVEVTLRRLNTPSQQEVVIQVRDHGNGVPEELLENIFKPFYRVADARDRSSGGRGLGLTITDRIVRLHGGRIEASNSPDCGLIIEIRLPTACSEISATDDPKPIEVT